MLACGALADSKARPPERLPFVGELEQDITANAEPVSLAAAGLQLLSAGPIRQSGKAVRRDSGIPARRFRCAAPARHAPLPAPSHGRGAPLPSAGAQGQFKFRRCAIESRTGASFDRTLRRGHLQLPPRAGYRAGSSGNSLQSRRRLSGADNVGDALSNFDRVLAIAPGHAGALVNRGNTLLRLNRPVEAIASYDAALAALPGHPQILTNRGHALRRLDRPVDALADFRAALAAAPEFAEAHFEAAMTQLSMGDFDAGWKEYEWRWKTGAFAPYLPQPKVPLWLGEAPISGKRILLHAEQGVGDTP